MMNRLTEEAARYNVEIQGLLTVLFPEFTQVFADPCRRTARALLSRYPSAQAFVAAGLAAVTASLQEIAPKRYGERTAQRLLMLATQTVASGVARKAREQSLQILCDQLEHTQEHLAELEAEMAALLKSDAGAASLQSVPEFGAKTVAVLRAEVVFGSCSLLNDARERVRRVLPAPGGARGQENECADGGDAQDVDGGVSVVKERGQL